LSEKSNYEKEEKKNSKFKTTNYNKKFSIFLSILAFLSVFSIFIIISILISIQLIIYLDRY